jgi:hypothetical protein
MDPNTRRPRTHFHVHGDGKNNRNWERFATFEDVLNRALELGRAHVSGQFFKMEEFSDECLICKPNIPQERPS